MISFQIIFSSYDCIFPQLGFALGVLTYCSKGTGRSIAQTGPEPVPSHPRAPSGARPLKVIVGATPGSSRR